MVLGWLISLWLAAAVVIGFVPCGWLIMRMEQKQASWANRRRVAKLILTSLAIFCLVLVSAPLLYEFPPNMGDRVSGDVFTFNGDDIIRKDWGAWTLPFSGREVVRYRQCHPLSRLNRSSVVGDSPQEQMVSEGVSNSRAVRFVQINLCIISPAEFFADHRRRHLNSPEAEEVWREADTLASTQLLTTEPGLKDRFDRIEPLIRSPLAKMGFRLYLMPGFRSGFGY